MDQDAFKSPYINLPPETSLEESGTALTSHHKSKRSSLDSIEEQASSGYMLAKWASDAEEGQALASHKKRKIKAISDFPWYESLPVEQQDDPSSQAREARSKSVTSIVKDQGSSSSDQIKIDCVEIDLSREASSRPPLSAKMSTQSFRVAPSPEGAFDYMDYIKRNIASLMHLQRTTARSMEALYTARYTVENFTLDTFLREQGYPDERGKAFRGAIAIVGEPNDAEATTFEEYLCRTWPMTGHKICMVFSSIDWVAYEKQGFAVVKAKLNKDVTVNMLLNQDAISLKLDTDGFDLAVFVDIGQQLAWLGAAVSWLPSEEKVLACTPHFQFAHRRGSSEEILSGAIRITFESQEADLEPSPGYCWHKMFQFPMIIRSFPIQRKTKESLGLEIPLNMMAELTGSSRVVEFEKKLYIKGFSTMLVATALVDDQLVWHYCYKADGSRISYFDHDVTAQVTPKISQLNKLRHVVGWCQHCKYYAGSLNAQYGISKTDLPRPTSGFILERVSLSVGKGVRGGVTFAPAARETPPHLVRHGNISRLRWISSKYVIFWDEEVKRAWLVNGTSALLHLVMGALEHYRTDEFRESFLFEPQHFEAPTDYSPASAIKVLTNLNNRILKIYPDKVKFDTIDLGNVDAETTFFLFDDLVDQFYHVLEQRIEYFSHLAGNNGINLKLRLRKQMEGWDFADLVSDQDALPRVATIPSLGYGWVDFIRSINALPIFGCGFGELLQPVPSQSLCPQWSSLPMQRCLLAASNVDLSNIMHQFGDRKASPWLLTMDLRWLPQPHSMLGCPCQDNTTRGCQHHIEPIQTLRPATTSSQGYEQFNETLPADGAVVFGHNKSSGRRWFGRSNKQASRNDFEHNEIVSEASSLVSAAMDSSDLSGYPSTSTTFYSSKSSACANPLTATNTKENTKLNTSEGSKPKKSLKQLLSPRFRNKGGREPPQEAGEAGSSRLSAPSLPEDSFRP